MNLTWQEKKDLAIIGNGTKAKIREDRPGRYDCRKDCVCYACQAYTRAIARARSAYVVYGNKSNYQPLTDYALPKDKIEQIPDPNTVVKEIMEERQFFANKRLPEHVHQRRLLGKTLVRFLPHSNL